MYKSRPLQLHISDLIVPFCLWLIIYIPFFPFRFLHVDEAVYILVAQTILHGGIPYVDCWDHKPPLVYFLYWIILKIFGTKNYTAITYVTILFSLCNTTLVYLIGRAISSRLTATLCAIWYPIVSIMLLANDAVVPNTEIYMETFCLIGIYSVLLYFEVSAVWLICITGIAIGIGSAFKQPGIIDGFVVAVSIFVYSIYKKQWLAGIKRASIVVAGCAGVWGIIILYFSLKNALPDMWFEVFSFNFLYSSNNSYEIILRSLIAHYTNGFKSYPMVYLLYFIGIACSVIVVFIRALSISIRSKIAFIMLWHICALIGVSAGGVFYPHYFIQLMPSFVLIMLVPVFVVVDRLSKHIRRIIYILGSVYFGLMAIPFFVTPAYNPLHNTPTLKLYNQYSKYAHTIGTNFYNHPIFYSPKFYWQYQRFVRIIQEYTHSDETIFIWGFLPELYLVSNRRPATRFVYSGFLTGKFHALPNLLTHCNSTLHTQYNLVKKLFLADLDRNKPALIIIEQKPNSSYEKFFYDYLNIHYKPLQYDISYLRFYIRKNRGVR